MRQTYQLPPRTSNTTAPRPAGHTDCDALKFSSACFKFKSIQTLTGSDWRWRDRCGPGGSPLSGIIQPLAVFTVTVTETSCFKNFSRPHDSPKRGGLHSETPRLAPCQSRRKNLAHRFVSRQCLPCREGQGVMRLSSTAVVPTWLPGTAPVVTRPSGPLA